MEILENKMTMNVTLLIDVIFLSYLMFLLFSQKVIERKLCSFSPNDDFETRLDEIKLLWNEQFALQFYYQHAGAVAGGVDVASWLL